jgi:hypothetical protein
VVLPTPYSPFPPSFVGPRYNGIWVGNYERMPSPDAYYNWCTQMSRTLPSLGAFLRTLPATSLSQRKALLLATRVQQFPHRSSRVYTRLQAIWDSPVYLGWEHLPPDQKTSRFLHESLIDILSPISSYLASVSSGFLSACIRSAPIDQPAEFHKARWEALSKEVTAGALQYNPTELDFTIFLSPRSADQSRRFAWNLEPAPLVSEHIYRAFSQLGNRLHNTALYPKLSTKSLGRGV